VERNPAAVRYACGLGHEVVESDALAFLQGSRECFDGIYCSHFVEHLPVEALGNLVRYLADALRPGGVLLLVFPDPESIRSQLLGFWRDPEHVRFYHPDLVELMCRAAGLQPEFHSQHRPGRRVISFPEQRPAPSPEEFRETSGGGLWGRLLAGLGLARQARLRALEQRLVALDRDLDTLWTVNQTWAWDDNAVLRLRKPAD
jgi:O-antigen chain-terminating methyltransferase